MISDKQYIQIIPEPIDKDDCEVCVRCDLSYVDTEKELIIRFGNTKASDFYGGFCSNAFIEELIDNKRYLDKKITPDLGYEWNQFFQGILKKTDIFRKYHFASNDHTLMRPYYNSWFYNDEDGNIIFEISPFYPYHYETKKSNPNFITYKEWIKNYKVVVRKIIPKETLMQWNEQAKSYHPTCHNSNC